MMEAVHRYEGTVNQVMGDGIMALFGAPLAREDHAVRACYAALRMHAAVVRHAEELRQRQSIDVQIRVGLNSGEVVVRSIGSDLRMDYTAVGQTTHLASRMEQLARPGTTLLTAETLRLCEPHIEVRALGRVPIKGLVGLVEVYELVGGGRTRRRFEAGEAHGVTRFIGRQPELAVLRQAHDRVRAGHGQVVAHVGEPGVGKSRLLWQLVHSDGLDDCLVLESGAVSYGPATPYFPVVELLRAYFAIGAQEDAARIREKVTTKVLSLDRELEPLLAAWLALLDVPADDPQWEAVGSSQRRARTLDALQRLFLRQSRMQPLVLVVEDLQWIDSETQVVLDRLVESLPAAPILLLVTYRPEYRHGWGHRAHFTELRIDPLPPGDAAELLDALLGPDPWLGPLKQLLAERTEGNPYFLEESVRTLAESQVLVGSPGAYRLAKAVDSVQIPPTVEGVLAARIDRLPPDSKRLLQTAAVVGREVPLAVLEAVSELPADALAQALANVREAEFLRETHLFPEPAYTFAHALTHEVAYKSLLSDRRQALHMAAAQALEALYADRLEEVYDRLAYHYARTPNAPKAIEYQTRFARKAARGHGHVETIAALREAADRVDGLPPDARDPVLLDLALREVQSLNWLGRNEESLELLLRHRERVEGLGDPLRAGRYYFSLGTNYGLLGAHARAVDNLRRAVEEADRCGDERTMGRAYALLTLESFWAGEPAQGVEDARRAVALLERTQQRYWLALAHFYAATIYFLMGEIQQALAAATQAGGLGEAIGNLAVQSYAASTTGVTYAVAREWEAGIRACRRGLDLAPDPLTRSLALGLLGLACLEKGDAAEATRCLEEAAARTGRFRYRQNECWFTALLSEAHLLKGDATRAHDLARTALAVAIEVEFRLAAGLAQRALGRVAIAGEKWTEAEEWLTQAAGTFTAIQARLELARTRVELAGLLARHGQREAAGQHLDEALGLFGALGASLHVARTQQAARDLGLRRSERPLS
jgi:tetratricopeptide (TPR) repeat protein